MVDKKASASYDTPAYDFMAGISAEINAERSGIIDYDRLANTMVQAMEQADITAKIGFEEVWNSTKDSWNQDCKKLKKSPLPV